MKTISLKRKLYKITSKPHITSQKQFDSNGASAH